MLSSEELEQIPTRYRWFLKLFLRLPNPSLPYFVLRKLPEFEGVFWVILAPILLTFYFFFSIWLVAFLSLHIIFPLSLLIALVIPALIFVFFLRIQLERTILWWKNIQGSFKEWEISRATEELTELLRKQQKKGK